MTPLARVTSDLGSAEPVPPNRFRCPTCGREHDEAAWQSLQWLQFAGAVRSGRLFVAVEVRRCVCASAICREAVLPMVEVAS